MRTQRERPREAQLEDLIFPHVKEMHRMQRFSSVTRARCHVG